MNMIRAALAAAAVFAIAAIGFVGSASAQMTVNGGEFPLDPGACYDNNGAGIDSPIEIAWIARKSGADAAATFYLDDGSVVEKMAVADGMWSRSPGDHIQKICNEGAVPVTIIYLQYTAAAQ